MFYRVNKKRYEIQRPEFKCKLTEEMRPDYLKKSVGNVEKKLNRSRRYIRSSDPFNCAKWQMIGHRHDTNNPENTDRKKIVQKVLKNDGLSSLNYTLKAMTTRYFYNYVLIDVHAPSMDEFKTLEKEAS